MEGGAVEPDADERVAVEHDVDESVAVEPDADERFAIEGAEMNFVEDNSHIDEVLDMEIEQVHEGNQMALLDHDYSQSLVTDVNTEEMDGETLVAAGETHNGGKDIPARIKTSALQMDIIAGERAEVNLVENLLHSDETEGVTVEPNTDERDAVEGVKMEFVEDNSHIDEMEGVTVEPDTDERDAVEGVKMEFVEDNSHIDEAFQMDSIAGERAEVNLVENLSLKDIAEAFQTDMANVSEGAEGELIDHISGLLVENNQHIDEEKKVSNEKADMKLHTEKTKRKTNPKKTVDTKMYTRQAAKNDRFSSGAVYSLRSKFTANKK